MKKFLALTLALLMVLPALVACGGTGDGGTTTGGAPSISTAEGDYVSKLPTIDQGGAVLRVIGQKGDEPQYTNFEVVSSGNTGDVVGDAVYNRNEYLKQVYNFEIDFDGFDTMSNEVNTKMDGYFSSQDDMYDICLFRSRYIRTYVQTGYLKNLNNIPYLDFDHPTWDKEFNETLTIDGKLFFTTNDFLLQEKMRTSLVFYNREMARSQGYIEADEYMEEKYVDANNWTLDVFAEMTKEQAADLDGGGKGGLGDKFGLAADDKHQFTHFCVGAGFAFSENDGGEISMNKATTMMERIVTNVAKFAFEEEQAMYSNFDISSSWSDAEDIFADSRALFHSAYVGSFHKLSQKADFEYGVLPYPKYDESQSRYYSLYNAEFGTVLAIPFTVSNDEKVGYMLEALSEVSHTTTYPTFIRDKVKLQDAYDEVAAKKLELIFDSVYLELAVIYDPNDIYSMMGTTMMSYRKADRFKGLYDGKYDAANIAFEEIMADIEKLD